MVQSNWLDRSIGWVSPRSQFQRMRARIAIETLRASYDAASTGRRTQGWRRNSGDANSVIGPSLSLLRDRARDLVRNNGHAESALQTICDNVVGRGIVPSVQVEAFKRWAESRDCDADGINNFAGIQKLIVRTVVESGEALVRLRRRRLSDGLAIPIQLQVLEPDFLDSSRDRRLPNGGRVVQGVEFDPIGRRVAYHLFSEHPGSMLRFSSGTRLGQSRRVPASEIVHVFKQLRPGQVRGASHFAPVLLRFRDFDDYADATLMKQKVAALLTVFTTDIDGTAPLLGAKDADNATYDSLEPGLISNLPPGRSVEVVQPPTVREHKDFSEITLREIATGLGIAYEDLTGDYTNLPFSAARMSRLRQWGRVMDFRWRILCPQFLNPVWAWAMQAATIASGDGAGLTGWTAPPLPMLDPDKEGLAFMRNIRAGALTLPEAVRERGHNVEEFLDELKDGMEMLDERGIILDSDPRRMTQAGQLHPAPADGADGEGAAALAELLSHVSEKVAGNGAAHP